MNKLFGLWLSTLLTFGLAACEKGGDSLDIPPEEDDLVASFDKEDTGYLSDQATEMEGLFVAEMHLATAGMSEAERDTLVSQLQAGSWTLRSLVGDHIKYAKNQLNTEKLHMNLSAQDIVESSVAVEGTTVRVNYTLRLETIVSYEELREAGIDPGSLVDRAFPVVLPADHRDITDKAGEACAEGHDAGSLADYNYFYYFEPDKAGCELPTTNGVFTLNSLLPSKTTFPEYHLLTADNKVTVAVFFGAAGHDDEVPYHDEGMREHREFVSALKSRSFRKTGDLEPKGERYERTRAGLQEIVDVVSPTDLAALKHDTDGLFRKALGEHEVIIYDGHSFYGSLGVLGDKDAYPADTYQVLFMNSCWSYEYYTTQVFEKKASAADPSGWALADVVNNTEAGWFLNMAEESRILLTNLLAGCESGGIDGTRQFTWDAIIEAMNKHALQRYRSWGLKSHEIYGVSGVRTNCYDPNNPESCKGTRDDPADGEPVTYTSEDRIDIPDDDATGIRSTLTVAEDVAFTGISVTLDIEHTWVGDLDIELAHAGRTISLQSREGGSQTNLARTYNPIGFDGLASAGDWTLIIRDGAARDTGALRSWSLSLMVQGEAQDPITVDSSPNLDIPDNDPGGIADSLDVAESRTVRGLQVELDITHTYIGDLLVSLEHAGTTALLHENEGGSAQDIVKQYTLSDFDGADAQGAWTLKVVDSAGADTGRLNRWSLSIGG